MFDEILSDAGRVDYLRGGCCNAAIFDLPAGDRTLRFFEVYTCKYLQAAVYGWNTIYIPEKSLTNAPADFL